MSSLKLLLAMSLLYRPYRRNYTYLMYDTIPYLKLSYILNIEPRKTKGEDPSSSWLGYPVHDKDLARVSKAGEVPKLVTTCTRFKYTHSKHKYGYKNTYPKSGIFKFWVQ